MSAGVGQVIGGVAFVTVISTRRRRRGVVRASVGVNVTASVWPAAGASTVPAAGAYTNVPGTFAVAFSCVALERRAVDDAGRRGLQLIVGVVRVPATVTVVVAVTDPTALVAVSV